jgi:hypothetical protein
MGDQVVVFHRNRDHCQFDQSPCMQALLRHVLGHQCNAEALFREIPGHAACFDPQTRIPVNDPFARKRICRVALNCEMGNPTKSTAELCP